MAKVYEISSIAEAQALIEQVECNMEKARDQVLAILHENAPKTALAKLRFENTTRDPMGEKEINFTEMLNQSFSDLVVLHAAQILLTRYPGKALKLQLGATNGFDIEDEGQTVVAECFAAVNANNNQKLQNDSKKLLEKTKNADKYIFYYEQDHVNTTPDEHVENGITYMRLGSF